MPTLIALLSTGKGTWGQVTQIIKSHPWTHIYLITNQFGKDNLTPLPNTTLITLPQTQDLQTTINHLKSHLKVTDLEVALNFTSGTGFEHMAMLQAVLELGLNFRLVTIKNFQLHSLGLER